MLQKLLRRVGMLITLLLVVSFAILSSVMTYLTIGFFFLGEIDPVGIFLSAIIPATTAPFFFYYLLFVLHKLDLAQKALRANEQKYRQLVQYAPAGICEIDFVTPKFISVNEVMCEYTGYSEAEFLALSPVDLLTEDSRKLFFERQQRVLQGEQIPQAVEYKIKGKNGRELWVLLNTRLEHRDKAQVKATVVVYDITERRRDEEALRWERDRARAIEEAAAIINSTLDPNQVLDRIMEQVSRVVPNDGINIMLIAGEQARLVRGRGYDDSGSKVHSPLANLSIAEIPNLQRIRETGKPLIITDTTLSPDWVPIRKWVRSNVTAPIVLRETVIGFLNVSSTKPDFFTQAHAEMLLVFANHAATAIENARLYEAEQERRKISETLRQASTFLNSTLALDELLGLILEQLGRVIPYDSASVQRLQAEYLEIIACRGFEQPDRLVGVIFPLDPKFPNSRVITTKAPLVFKDITRHYPHFQDEADTYGTDHVRSWLGVPLVVKDQVIGMISLDGAEGRAFSDEEAQLAMTFANQAAIAIENARLFAETERLKAFNESVVQTVPGAIILADAGGNFTFVNPAMVDLLDYTPEELIGQYWKTILPPDQQPIVEAADARRNRGQTDRYELELLHKNGKRIPVLVSGSPRFDPDTGRFAGTLAVLTDITEHKQAEEALRKSEERYRAIVEDQTEFIGRFSPERVLTFANEAYFRYFGQKREEAIGQNFMGRIPDEDRQALQEHLASLNRENPVGTIEHRSIINGQTYWQQWTNRAIFDEDGNLIEFQCVGRDITERKRVEEQIKASLKEKEVLLQEIYHRVKNNLQVISSLLNLQSGYIEDPKALEIFRDSEYRVRSMALIHEKLYQSRNLAQIDVVQYIRELTAFLSQAHQAHAQRIKLIIQAGDLFLDIERAVPCGLILNELVTNALKHAFPDGRRGEIRIDLGTNRDGQVILKVGDNGVGFPQDVDFHQTESLGLQLVNTLVGQLEGNLELDHNGGTEFRITFPAA